MNYKIIQQETLKQQAELLAELFDAEHPIDYKNALEFWFTGYMESRLCRNLGGKHRSDAAGTFILLSNFFEKCEQIRILNRKLLEKPNSN